jgi:hypothetical protein
MWVPTFVGFSRVHGFVAAVFWSALHVAATCADQAAWRGSLCVANEASVARLGVADRFRWLLSHCPAKVIPSIEASKARIAAD